MEHLNQKEPADIQRKNARIYLQNVLPPDRCKAYDLVDLTGHEAQGHQLYLDSPTRPLLRPPGNSFLRLISCFDIA